MKPLIFFIKTDAEKIELTKAELIDIIEKAYESGLQEGKAVLENFDFEIGE